MKFLHPSLGDNLELLSECIERLSIKEHIPQIEVAIAEKDTILILRHLQPLTNKDEEVLSDFAQKLQITWYLQSGGLDTIKPLTKICFSLLTLFQIIVLKCLFCPMTLPKSTLSSIKK